MHTLAPETNSGQLEPGRQMRLSDLLGALSFAIDLTEGQPAGHSVRTCWIGVHLGRAAGLNEQRIWELYYMLLIKDSGCSSNAERLNQLFLADDLSFKRDFKLIDGSVPQFMQFLATHVGAGSGFSGRLATLLRVVSNTGPIVHELIDTRCHVGAGIARRLRFPEAVAEAITSLDEHWDGKGMTEGLKGEAIPLYSRIALLAQVAEIFFTGEGKERAISEVSRRSGTWFDPHLVDLFKHLADSDEFWTTLASPDLPEIVFALDPADACTDVDDDYLDDITAAFAGIVDAKSSFTAGHSERVAEYTDLIARELGLNAQRRRTLRRAALLHDIGKLGVSNSIINKPGPLNAEEWKAVRQHTIHSANVLSRVAHLSNLVPVARSHHERLDGKGYPDGLKGDEIGLDVRIVTTADVFDALTAERPYRHAMSRPDALAIMEADLGKAFDPNCFAALNRSLESMNELAG
jgi:putative nucleotidyltransferase with HDIG domain